MRSSLPIASPSSRRSRGVASAAARDHFWFQMSMKGRSPGSIIGVSSMRRRRSAIQKNNNSGPQAVCQCSGTGGKAAAGGRSGGPIEKHRSLFALQHEILTGCAANTRGERCFCVAGRVIEFWPHGPGYYRGPAPVGVDAHAIRQPPRPCAADPAFPEQAPRDPAGGVVTPGHALQEAPMTTPVSFDTFELAPPLGRALARLGITAPTPIQAAAIPVLLSGADLVATAPTGTGKTAAFMLPALHRIATSQGAPGRGARVLVLTPTRELAQQVELATRDFARMLPRFTSVCITGGASYQVQNRQLAAPHEVLVATPGRFIDQLRGGRIDLSRIDTLVLDEADRMLDMGFS